MTKENPNFCKGLFVKRHPKAPAFVICNLGFKVDEFVAWLRQNQAGEYVSVDIKLSQKGDKYYAEINNFKPNQPKVGGDEVEDNQKKLNNYKEEVEYPEDEIYADSIPFYTILK